MSKIPSIEYNSSFPSSMTKNLDMTGDQHFDPINSFFIFIALKLHKKRERNNFPFP